MLGLDFEIGVVVRVKPARGIVLTDRYVRRYRSALQGLRPLQGLRRFRLTRVPRLRHVFNAEDDWAAFKEQFSAWAARLIPETHTPMCDWREPGKSSSTCSCAVRCDYLGAGLCVDHWQKARHLVDKGEERVLLRRLGRRDWAALRPA